MKIIDTTNFTVRFWAWGYYLHFRPVRAVRHWWQRCTRGFDDSELWSLDWTISCFVLPRLKAFRDMEKVGCPAEFLGADDDVEAGIAAFRLVLDKMIFAFECKVDEGFGLPELKSETVDIGGEHGMGYRLTNFGEYHAAQKARQVLVDEGLALFVKYMHCLWD